MLRTTSATVVSVAILFEIVGSTLLAWIAFGETPPAGAYPAAVLIAAGIVLVVLVRPPARRRRCPRRLERRRLLGREAVACCAVSEAKHRAVAEGGVEVAGLDVVVGGEDHGVERFPVEEVLQRARAPGSYRNIVSWVAVASQRRSGDGFATDTPRESDSSPTQRGMLTPLVERGLSKR